MDCEAAQVLEGIQEQIVVLSEDPNIKIPMWGIVYNTPYYTTVFFPFMFDSNPSYCFSSFDKGLQRAKKNSDYTSPQYVKEVLQYPYYSLIYYNIISLA